MNVFEVKNEKWAYPLAVLTLIVFIVLRVTYQSEFLKTFDAKMAELLLVIVLLRSFIILVSPNLLLLLQ